MVGYVYAFTGGKVVIHSFQGSISYVQTVPTTTSFWSLIQNKCQTILTSKHAKSPHLDRPNSDAVQGPPDDSKPLPLSALMTPHVLIAMLNYAALALFDMALRSLIPVFCATPVNMGGLGFESPRIGNILAAFGIANGLFQVFSLLSYTTSLAQKWCLLAELHPAYRPS
jgi:hypothetical protein